MHPSSTSKRNRIIASVLYFLVVTGILLSVGGNQEWMPYHRVIGMVGAITLFVAGMTTVMIITLFLFTHGIGKGGLKYVRAHYRVICRINTELLDAGVYVRRYMGQEEVAVLPKIKVRFSDDLKTGEVQIQRRLKDGKRFEDIDISAALDKYVVEQSYISADGNSYLYDIFDASFDRQLIFDDCTKYIEAVKKAGDYSLLIDAVTTIPLHHSLICGQTGSGKSYLVDVLILQMLRKNVAYTLYFCDPKRSGLAVIGRKIAPERSADTIEGILGLLRSFHISMKNRMDEMKELLSESSRIDASYKDFGLNPSVMIFDEYLAFALALANCEKKVRDEVSSILSDVVLMGRQCGFFLWLVMQSAPSTQIPTFIRDQMVWKVVLGNSDRSTYTVTFDSSAEIPTGKFSLGYGCYTYAGMTEKPKVLAAPTIRDFEILDVLSEDV